MLLKRKCRVFLQILLVCFVMTGALYLFFIASKYFERIETISLENFEKIDWNDYELMKRDDLRTGFGEKGEAGELRDEQEIAKNDELFESFGMSVVISDKMSVNRSIPDFRHSDCLKKTYYSQLPRISIIIIFNNEIFSVFKRTLHSLYNRTPHELIEEVILVNDYSDLDYLYEPLRKYIDEHFLNIKFKIINLTSRHGLMKARIIGAKATNSDYLFVMEPHCEMSYNWLPPLLAPLLLNQNTVTLPIIDNIEWQQLFFYQNDLGNKGSRGVFDWDLQYNKLKRILPADKSKHLDPFAIPIMTGGIYMIHKNYFFQLGPYDEELLIWGAENLEMSFKINLCGGQLLEVPCSRIGHVFRAFTKSRKHENGIDFETFNKKRIVEVWFDEFKDYVYRRNRNKYKIKVGDLSKPRKLREKLKCKPFKYFFDFVAPDMLKMFPFSTPKFASGQIKLLNNEFCLEMLYNEKFQIKLRKCSNPMSQRQNFYLSWHRDIRVKDSKLCIDLYEVSATSCHMAGGNQLFKYDITTNQIVSPKINTCLEANLDEMNLKFTKCNETLEMQKWKWSQFVNETALGNWEKSGKPLE